MNPSEFYSKYWKVKTPDGTLIEPRPLTPGEKELFDTAFELNMPVFVRNHGRGKSSFIVNPIVQEEIKKRKENR